MKTTKFSFVAAVAILTVAFSLLGSKSISTIVPAGAHPRVNPEATLQALRPESSELLKLVPNGGALRGRFGSGLAMSGDTAVIGHSDKDIGSSADQGSVYVFVRDGENWVQQAELVASDGEQFDQFGYDVDIDGDTIVVGSRWDDGPNRNQGSAYVFARAGNVWSEQAKLTPNDAAQDDNFGTSVTVSGDMIVVGAPMKNVQAGAAYVFSREGGVWSQERKLTASDSRSGDQFGHCVRSSGNTVVAGAPTKLRVPVPGGPYESGGAYVFELTGGSWAETAILFGAGDSFGESVDIHGDSIIAGAAGHWQSYPNPTPGFAYVYSRSNSTWSLEKVLTGPDVEVGDSFGTEVAIGDGVAVVTATYPPSGPWASTLFRPVVDFMFVRNGTDWAVRDGLTTASPNENLGGPTALGGPIAVDGRRVLTCGFGFASPYPAAGYLFVKSPAAPDLQAMSDTGASSSDNVTKHRNLAFDVTGADAGSTIELLRDGSVVDRVQNTGDPVILHDSVPADGTFEYKSRQIIDGEVSSLSDKLLVTVDTVGNQVTIQQNLLQLDPANSLPIKFNVTFTPGPVIGFGPEDISLIGSTADVSTATVDVAGTGLTYTVSVSNVRTDGVIRASVLPDAVTDLAGNTSEASTSSDDSVTLDTTPPTVTINRAANQPATTSTLPIRYDVVFSESVAGFDFTDVSLVGSTANVTNANISVSGSGAVYSVAISNVISGGLTVRASIKANAAADGARNLSLASTSTDNVVILDNVHPSVTVEQGIGQSDPAFVQPIVFAVVFSEDVTDFRSSSVSFGGSTADISSANVQITGTGNTYSVAVGNLSSSGLVRLSVPAGVVHDGLGNVNTASVSFDNAVTFNTKPKPFDFDGDGKTDIGIYRPGASAEWWITRSSNNSVLAAQFGTTGDAPAPADYTGDGKTDIAFFRPSTATWFVLRSEDFSFYGFQFGASTDTVAPADYDGDGKADAAVYRNGAWYIVRSTDGGVTIATFGVAGDKPVPADFDGDGKADLAIYRPNGGTGGEWWVQRTTAGLFSASFGSAEDKTVVGDWTGDGKADCAFSRPSTSTWYVLRSEDMSFFGFPFGNSTDTPAPGDYDGDGKMDAAVFRQPEAQWYVNKSSGGVTSLTFGSAGDRPVPSSYVR
jgi:hypothetical protein